MSGALGGGATFVHCGGWDAYNDKYTKECFALQLEDNNRAMLAPAAPLPYNLRGACHGSDGQRLAVAGGYERDGQTYHRKVLLLEDVTTVWRTVAGRLGGSRSDQAGVLVGDYLLCLGG